MSYKNQNKVIGICEQYLKQFIVPEKINIPKPKQNHAAGL